MGQVIFAALDVETTGLDVKRHEVIDFAVVPLDDDFKISGLPEFSIRIRAEHPETAEVQAMQINRLNPAEGVSRNAAAEEFRQWLSDNRIEKIHPIAHNLEKLKNAKVIIPLPYSLFFHSSVGENIIKL